jgi:hypothetical protein
MSITPQQHAVYRAALDVADSIDPSGRFRAILHLLRFSGGEQVGWILSLRFDAVGFVRLPSAGRRGGNAAGEELEFDGRTIDLDEEAVAELKLYARRRSRHVRMRLVQRRERSSLWYAHVICAGGHAVTSLGTHDRELARQRVRERRMELACDARSRGSRFLFPASWKRDTHVSLAELRQWVNAAVGRGSLRSTREACEQTRPIHRTQERRRRKVQDPPT